MRHLFANRKKLIVGIIVGVMAIVIFAWRYIAVNKACPPAQVEQYSLGDTVLHNGVEYTLTDYKVLSQDEFCDEYEIDPIHVKAGGQESKIIVFTMYAKNVSDHNVNVDFAGQMLLQMGDYLCSYYKCGHRKRKEGERCHMKAFRKELIESFVVKRALGYVLQDSVIAMLADALVENQKRENTHLPALQEELEKVNKKIDNIAAAIEEGIVTQTTKERLTALEAQREELQISIFEEETSHPKLTKEYVVQWLKSFKQRDLRDPKVQRQVIECFVNTVYVFENKLIVNLNLRDGDKPIALSKGNGSDIETFGSPKSTTSFEVVLFSLYALFNRCRA